MDYLHDIKMAVTRDGTVKDAAEKMGFSPAFLGDVLAGEKKVSMRLSFALEEHYGMNGLALLNAQLERKRAEHKTK